MHERGKLAEARFFFDRMREATGRRPDFDYHTSAFLSAARSVCQYSREEAMTKNALPWYDDAVKARPVIGQLRDLRNTSIHDRPVRTVQRVEIAVAFAAGASLAVEAEVRDADGNVKPAVAGDEPSVDGAAVARPVVAPTRDSVAHFFDGQPDEDALALCERYLAALDDLVAAGQSAGILTP